MYSFKNHVRCKGRLRSFLAKILSLLSLFLPLVAFALSFPLPKPGSSIVGAVQTTAVQNGEDFSDIALRFGIGYFEVLEANPGIDPDKPHEDAMLVVPTQYILPRELKPNLVLINLAEMRLYLIPKTNDKVYIFPVGIGKVDWDTPTGLMHIERKTKNPTWRVPEKIRKYRAAMGDVLPKVIPPGPENPLGSYALRLSQGDFLIHGTNLAAGVGRRSSAGCLRLYEEDVKTLFDNVDIGTPVLIINQPYKAGLDQNKLYLEAHLPLFEQRIKHSSGNMAAVIEAIDVANEKRLSVDWQRAFKVAKEHLCVPRVVSKH